MARHYYANLKTPVDPNKVLGGIVGGMEDNGIERSREGRHAPSGLREAESVILQAGNESFKEERKPMVSKGSLSFKGIASILIEATGMIIKTAVRTVKEAGKDTARLGFMETLKEATGVGLKEPEKKPEQKDPKAQKEEEFKKQVRFEQGRTQESDQTKASIKKGKKQNSIVRILGRLIGHQDKKALFKNESVRTEQVETEGNAIHAKAMEREEKIKLAASQQAVSLHPGKKGAFMGENEIGKGLERSGGGHWTTGSG